MSSFIRSQLLSVLVLGLASCTVGFKDESEPDTRKIGYPNLVLLSPASSPGTDLMPSFTVTVDSGVDFSTAGWKSLDLYASLDCSGSSIANNSDLVGSSTSIALSASLSIGASGTYEFSVKATDDLGNTICSYDEGGDEGDFDYETYVLDITTLRYPNIVLQSPASSPGADNTPAFTVTADGGGNFTTAKWTRVDLYASQNCSGSSIANNAALTGSNTSVILTAGSSIGGSGTYQFSIKATDADGNTKCSYDEANSEADLDFETYVLDVTNPGYPNIVLQTPASSPGADDTPAFTVTVDGGSNFTTADWTRVDLYASNNCSGTSIANNASLTGTDTSVILTAGSSIGASGTYEFSVKATDDVGNTICSYDEANSEADLDFETYVLDVTNPSYPNIVIAIPAPNPGSDDTPSFTVTVDGGSNFTTADWTRVDLYASNNCSGTSIANNASLTGTDTSVILTAGSSIGASGTYEFSVKATDDVGNTICSYDEANSEADQDFETYELDATNPSYPNIVLQSPASSPGTDDTPAFTVTVDGGANFTTADWTRIDLYASNNCSGSSIANNASLTGTDTSVILTAGSSIGSTGTYEFSVKATDDVGNTICSYDEANSEADLDFETYVLDVTNPSYPNIVLQTPASSPGADDTPAFTVTVDGGSNFTTADWTRIDLYASNNCSGTSIANNTSLTGTDTSVVLTAGSSIGSTGTYEFSVKATDDVGNTICSYDEANSEADLDFETYVLDVTNPSYPNIVLQTPASSPGADDTPSFTITVDGGANFTTADWTRIDLYASNNCSGTSIANNASLTGTDTSVILTAGSSIGSTGTYEFSVKATDDVGNTICSYDEANSEADLDFETYELDATNPSYPNIVLQTPASSPGADDTPAFTVTVDGGSNFTTADWTRVDLYASNNCSGSSIANNASLTGTDTSVILTAGSSIGASGTYEFSVKATDDVGNTICSYDEANSEADLDFETYELDATNPSYPNIVLQTPASSPGADDTPSFTITVDGGANFTTADWTRIDLYASNNCSGTSIANNASLTGTDTSVILTAGSSIGASGTYEFSVKATDDVGNTICSYDEANSEADLDFETYELDVTDPATPEIMLAVPQISPGTDSTPIFTVSFENSANFIAAEKITIHSNNTCTSAVSSEATGITAASTNIEITSAQTANTSVNYYAKVEDAAGNSSCSVAHSVNGEGTRYATYEYDTAAPTAPGIVLKSATTPTPSQDAQPVFTITLDNGDTFEAQGVATITLHEGTDCSGAAVATVSSPTGTSEDITRDASASQQSTVYRAKVADAAGNATCSTAHSSGGDDEGVEFATHLYDATAPTWADSLTLSAATSSSNTETPTFTYTSNASDGVNGSGVSGYEYAIDAKSGTCDSTTPDEVDWTTAPASGSTISSLTLSYGTTYCFMMRAFDNVGLTSTVRTEEWTAQLDITVAARYSNATNWMDYVRSDSTGSETFSAGNAACDGTETKRVDCRHGGEHRKVEIGFASDCTGLSMTDSLGAFDWSCTDNGSTLTFYGSLKSTKRLKDLIDFATPAFQSNAVTLTGCVDCPLSSSSAVWWTNTVSALPNNSGSGDARQVLSSASTIYTLDSSRDTAGYSISASKVGIVIDSDAELEWNNSTTTDATTLYCHAGISCMVGYSSSAHFGWIEGVFDGTGSSATNKATRGISFNSNKFVRTPYLEVKDTLTDGIVMSAVKYSTLNTVIVTGDTGGTSTVKGDGIRLNTTTIDTLFESTTVAQTGDAGADSGLYLQDADNCIFNTVTVTTNTGSGLNVASSSTGNTFTSISGTGSQSAAQLIFSGGTGNNYGNITSSNVIGGQNSVYITGSSSTFGNITITGDSGASATCTAYGILYNASNNTLGNISVSECGDGAADQAIYIQGGTGNTFGDITITNQTGTGFHSIGSSNTFGDFTITNATNGGLSLSANSNTFGTITVNTTGQRGLELNGNYNTFGDIYVSNTASNPFYHVGDYSTFGNIFVANSSSNFTLAGAVDNRFGYIVSQNNSILSASISIASSSHNNRIKGMLSINSRDEGIRVQASSNNIIGPSTVSNNMLEGFYNLSNGTILHSPLAINSSRYGIYIHNNLTSSTTLVNAVISNSGNFGLNLTSTGNVLTRGTLMISSAGADACNMTSGGLGIVDATCTTAGTDGSLAYGSYMSGAVLRLPASLSGSFIGKASSDSLNTSDSSGTATYSTSLDWFNFEHLFRGWGQYDAAAWPNSAHRGYCTTAETCQIWDMALSSTDTVLLNRSGNGTSLNGDDNLNGTCNSGEICDVTEPSGDGSGDDDGTCESGEICFNTFDANGSCPVEVRGSRYTYSEVYTYDAVYSAGVNGREVEEVISDGIGDDDGVCETHEACSETGNACASGDICSQKFLLNAMEIEDTGGDSDYLCEQGETCLYLPNFGIYQGHGTLGECTYSHDGGLTGITMKGYLYNGR